jgi:hypothetical protein
MQESTNKAFFTIGAGLLGYLAAGVTIWQLFGSPLAEAVYFLTLALSAVTFLYLRLKGEYRRFREQYAEIARTIEQLERAELLSKGMLSLILYLTEKPVNDDQHHFTYIEEEYAIHGDDGTYKWIIEGQNIRLTPSSELILKIAGDAPVDHRELGLRVKDEISDKWMDDIRLLKDDAFYKVYAVKFPVPLGRGDTFRLSANCRWNNAFTRSRQYDYVFSAWSAYAAHGVDRFVGRIVSDVPLSQFILERLEEGQRVKDPVQPRIVDTSRTHTVLEWEISNPQHVFLLTFRKTVDRRTLTL